MAAPEAPPRFTDRTRSGDGEDLDGANRLRARGKRHANVHGHLTAALLRADRAIRRSACLPGKAPRARPNCRSSDGRHCRRKSRRGCSRQGSASGRRVPRDNRRTPAELRLADNRRPVDQRAGMDQHAIDQQGVVGRHQQVAAGDIFAQRAGLDADRPSCAPDRRRPSTPSACRARTPAWRRLRSSSPDRHA